MKRRSFLKSLLAVPFLSFLTIEKVKNTYQVPIPEHLLHPNCRCVYTLTNPVCILETDEDIEAGDFLYRKENGKVGKAGKQKIGKAIENNSNSKLVKVEINLYH